MSILKCYVAIRLLTQEATLARLQFAQGCQRTSFFDPPSGHRGLTRVQIPVAARPTCISKDEGRRCSGSDIRFHVYPDSFFVDVTQRPGRRQGRNL